MITEYILNLFTGIFLGFTDQLPEVDPQELDTWTSEGAGFFSSIWLVDGWLPIGFMVSAFLFLGSLRLMVLIYRAIHHFWKALPLT